MKVSTKGSPRREMWRERIQGHESSGLSVRAFCQRRGISEPSFYYWRKELSSNGAVSFALVETAGSMSRRSVPIELVLATGDRLQITPGVDAMTLRTVLAVLREQP